MQLEELILIDKLEDQIIDHPDASTKKDLNESLDETFQKKLNARAQQIKSTNNNNNRREEDLQQHYAHTHTHTQKQITTTTEEEN